MVGSERGREELHVLTLWQNRQHCDAAGEPPSSLSALEGFGEVAFEHWDIVRELAGIYADPPTAILGASRLGLLQFRWNGAPKGSGIDPLRAPFDQRLSTAPGFLAGAIAARPEEPSRLLVLLQWQSESTADAMPAARLCQDLPLSLMREIPLNLILGAALEGPSS